MSSSVFFFFFFNDTATTEIYTFPYTTLFRSWPWGWRVRRGCVPAGTRRDRSAEHTSELQSHSELVCRLLLEKKKKNKYSLYPLQRKIQHKEKKQHDKPM